jgi:DNA-directed RNA polymerase specialized sigma24 family protein
MTDDDWTHLRSRLVRAFDEDTAQEALMKLVTTYGTAPLSPWALAWRIARHTRLDGLKRMARAPMDELTPAHEPVDVETPERAAIARQGLERANHQALARAMGVTGRCQRRCCRP